MDYIEKCINTINTFYDEEYDLPFIGIDTKTEMTKTLLNHFKDTLHLKLPKEGFYDLVLNGYKDYIFVKDNIAEKYLDIWFEEIERIAEDLNCYDIILDPVNTLAEFSNAMTEVFDEKMEDWNIKYLEPAIKGMSITEEDKIELDLFCTIDMQTLNARCQICALLMLIEGYTQGISRIIDMEYTNKDQIEKIKAKYIIELFGSYTLPIVQELDDQAARIFGDIVNSARDSFLSNISNPDFDMDCEESEGLLA